MAGLQAAAAAGPAGRKIAQPAQAAVRVAGLQEAVAPELTPELGVLLGAVRDAPTVRRRASFTTHTHTHTHTHTCSSGRLANPSASQPWFRPGSSGTSCLRSRPFSAGVAHSKGRRRWRRPSPPFQAQPCSAISRSRLASAQFLMHCPGPGWSTSFNRSVLTQHHPGHCGPQAGARADRGDSGGGGADVWPPRSAASSEGEPVPAQVCSR